VSPFREYLGSDHNSRGIVLLVDEATSGVDPLSRRALWRALIAVKHERTILFTTHVSLQVDRVHPC